MLQKEAVSIETINLIKRLQGKDYLQNFVLAGGTSLALRHAHRESLDIDLFSQTDFNGQQVLEKLEEDFSFSMLYREKNTLKGFINEIKVDLVSHKYDNIVSPDNIEDVLIASNEDVIAMKLSAISDNGTRVKDFIDIHYLTEFYTIDEMLGFFEEKYKLQNSMHVLKSLNYFDDVSLDEWPVMLKNKHLTWEQIKNDIDNLVLSYVKNNTNLK